MLDKAGEDACKRPGGAAAGHGERDPYPALYEGLERCSGAPGRRSRTAIISKHRAERAVKPETVKIIRMSDVELTPVEWLWKPYLPFESLSAARQSGEGKT